MLRTRPVQSDLAVEDRGCLYCLGHGLATEEEHVIPAAFGLAQTRRWVIPPGSVCNECNGFLGRQVDAPFVHRLDILLARALAGVAGRGGPIDAIIGRDTVADLDLSIDGRTVRLNASKVEETEDGGLEFEVRPEQSDPPDIVWRSIRELWKMALGALWHANPRVALDPAWDHLRAGALGHPLKGYILQRPLIVAPIERVHLHVDGQTSSDPGTITFIAGGVILRTPLTPGHLVAGKDLLEAGWEIRTTQQRPPKALRFRLDPT